MGFIKRIVELRLMERPLSLETQEFVGMIPPRPTKEEQQAERRVVVDQRRELSESKRELLAEREAIQSVEREAEAEYQAKLAAEREAAQPKPAPTWAPEPRPIESPVGVISQRRLFR